MEDKELPLDAPPLYTSAIVTVPCAAASTASTTMARADIQQQARQYSCAKVIEIFARVAFIVILIMCVASTIALMVNISSTDAISQYEDNDYDDYEETSSYVLIALINIMLFASLSCTALALLCDIPVVVAHCITDRVMNSNAFRILDIIKLIGLTIMYVITFRWILSLIEPGSDFTPGPLIIIFLVFCCIIIVMGGTMTVWDCGHLSKSGTTAPSSQAVIMVPANSVDTTVV